LSERRVGRRGRWTRVLVVALAVVLGLTLLGLTRPAAAAYPVLPDADWSPLLGTLTGPALTPGASGAITFRLGNPLPAELIPVRVSLQVYSFTPTQGGSVQAPAIGSSPTLNGGGLGVNVTPPDLPPLIPTGTTWNWSVAVSVPSAAPTGDYAVRFGVTFTENNTTYVLESRGFFSASAWSSATEYPNGTPTINASQLGVSGVVPETSILVSPSSTPVVLYAVLGTGLGLAGLGAYWWARSETKSKSGARRPSPPQSAPTAFGSSRSSDGD
jgi:hypothetical protein